MDEGKRQLFQDPCSQYAPRDLKEKDHSLVIIMEGENYDDNNSTTSSSSSSSIEEDSAISNGSSSLDITDDASYSSSANSSGSLYDLSDLMAQLPIKRGLSKFYQGKSESFTSLSRVRSIEDLAKKGSPYRIRKMIKACSKSYDQGGLDNYKSFTLPKPVISKKSSRGLFSSASFPNRKGSFLSSCRPPAVPLQRNL